MDGRPRRNLIAAANAIVLCALGLTLAVGGSPLASASSTQALRQPLQQASHQLRTPISQLLAGAPAHGRVRLVTMTVDGSGRPHITVTTAADRQHAAADIAAVRESSDTVSVSVDHRSADLATGDPYRSLQWGLDNLHAEATWAVHTAAGVTVAIVDTGVDATHPDIAGRILSGAQFLGAATSSGDGRTDPNGHGTHVAGIIAAVANNGIGVAGLAQGVSILPVRVLDASGSGWDSDIADGIIYAADHGAVAINLSLGGSADDPTLAAAVRYAQSKNVVVVAAAGNSRGSGNPTFYPAAYPGVVSVAATDSTNASATFSETGSWVTLAAPGVSIASTYPGGQYVYISGTSMASPFVTATVALVRATAPRLSAAAVAADLVATAHDLGTPGRDNYFGAGLVDPLAAVKAAAIAAATPAPAPTTAAPTTAPATTAPPTTAPTSAAPTPTRTTTPAPAPTTTAAPTATAPTSAAPTPAHTTTPAPTTPAPATPTPAHTTAPAPTTPPPAAFTVSATLTLSSASSVSGSPLPATVTIATSNGRPIGGQLSLCSRDLGASAFVCTTPVTVTGSTAVTLHPAVGTDVYAHFLATATPGLAAPEVITPAQRIVVAPLVQISTAAGSIATTVTPPQGQVAALQHLVGMGWVTVVSHSLVVAGVWQVTGLPTGSYRVVVPASSQLLAVTTGTVTLH